MVPYKPDKIFVQQTSLWDPVARRVLERLNGIPVYTVQDLDEIMTELGVGAPPPRSATRVLVLARHAGHFMKECPGNGAEICCNYHVINFATNCHFECSYCILQSYLNNPAMVIYTNTGALMDEVRSRVYQEPNRFFRIGTGEMADSLALDDITGYSLLLVPFFAKLPNAILELKTKSDQISNLAGLAHAGRTVVSWSVNPPRICSFEERKTATLAERLAAARQCQAWGYKVGFHFDPLIHYEGWEADYEETVREIFHAVKPEGVAWVSLGALRFTPHLRDMVRRRFPKSRIPYGEFVPGHNAKLRYFRPIREEMYSKMYAWIRRSAPGVFVYLCMESGVVWKNSLDGRCLDTACLSDQMDALVQMKDPQN